MAQKKPKLKTELVGVRMPPKLRYGLELYARKKGLTLSDVMMRALEAYLEKDGLLEKISGEDLTILDKLWSESPSERIDLILETGYETAYDDKISRMFECIRIHINLLAPELRYSKKELYSFFDEHLANLEQQYNSTEAASELAINFLSAKGITNIDKQKLEPDTPLRTIDF